jgi:hypothetical protein
MRGEPVDRPPLLDEGVRDEVIERWHDEGLPRGRTHLDVFGLTPHENIGPDLTYRPRYAGRVFDLSPSEYRRAFDVSRRRFPRDWSRTARRLEARDHIVCLWASRGFLPALGVGDWSTLEPVLIATREQPERIVDRLSLYGDFCVRMLEMSLQDVAPEFIYLSEPIADNGGPLISPAMFEEFMLPVYRRIVATARQLGCEHILVSTYGHSARLFPGMLDAGVTMLWISEAPEVPDLDYRALRQRFGPALGLIGGIPARHPPGWAARGHSRPPAGPRAAAARVGALHPACRRAREGGGFVGRVPVLPRGAWQDATAGHAAVSDSGIARAVGAAGAETLTETGLAVGTPAT